MLQLYITAVCCDEYILRFDLITLLIKISSSIKLIIVSISNAICMQSIPKKSKEYFNIFLGYMFSDELKISLFLWTLYTELLECVK